MEQLRTALEHRLARLDGLAGEHRPHACPSLWLQGRDMLHRVVAHGKEMHRPAGEWSEGEQRLMHLLSRTVRIRRGQCYANAQRLLLAAGSLAPTLTHDLRYSEGYARLDHLATPFAHGWCLVNGRVWDPTLERVDVPVEYLGVALSMSLVHLALLHRGRLGPVLGLWCTSAGAQQDGIERSLRVPSPLRPRPTLGGAPARV